MCVSHAAPRCSRSNAQRQTGWIMTLLPVSCARADTYVQESGDARVLSHRPTPSHADLVGPSPVRLDGVEPTTLCGNLNISLIWPSNARYSEPVLNISRNGFIIITRIQNRRAQRLDIDQTMRYPHTPRGDTHHRHIRTPGSRTQLNTTKSPRRPPPAELAAARSQARAAYDALDTPMQQEQE